MAGGTLEAGSAGTVIDVLTAVLTRPAIDAYTGVATIGVVAGATVLAGVGHQLAFIHILRAVLAWGRGLWQVSTVSPHPCHLVVPSRLGPLDSPVHSGGQRQL